MGDRGKTPLGWCVDEIEDRLRTLRVCDCPNDTLALMSLALALYDIRESLRQISSTDRP